MDERFTIWNVLHDGEITAVSEDGDTLTMFVNIPYLRRRLKPLGDSFILSLAGVQSAECRNFDGAASSASSLRQELEIGSPTILHTESESMPITIHTSLGRVILDFQSIRFALDTGQDTDYKTIRRVSEEYWSEWRAKYKRGGSA